MAISTGCWPATIGSVSTSAWRPSTASCSCAAGRATSSEAISTFLRSRSDSRLASLAVVVVLPEPWRPTIMITAGGLTSRLSSAVSEPSISTSASLTILTTIWPGVTERMTSWPTAFSVTWSTKSRATGSATSASSSATRTSRIAERTSASAQRAAPAKLVEYAAKAIAQAVEHPNLLESMKRKTQNTPADETSSASVSRGTPSMSCPLRRGGPTGGEVREGREGQG